MVPFPSPKTVVYTQINLVFLLSFQHARNFQRLDRKWDQLHFERRLYHTFLRYRRAGDKGDDADTQGTKTQAYTTVAYRATDFYSASVTVSS